MNVVQDTRGRIQGRGSPDPRSQDVDVRRYPLRCARESIGGSLPTLWEVVALVALFSNPVAAQGRRTVWDGVFTSAQAARGKTIFATACADCHGADLSTPNRPPLKGEPFLNHWVEGGLDALFTRVQSMPNRENLGESGHTDVLAFLLEANGFPSGTRELNGAAKIGRAHV